jgi:hypothetical protein
MPGIERTLRTRILIEDRLGRWWTVVHVDGKGYITLQHERPDRRVEQAGVTWEAFKRECGGDLAERVREWYA